MAARPAASHRLPRPLLPLLALALGASGLLRDDAADTLGRREAGDDDREVLNPLKLLKNAARNAGRRERRRVKALLNVTGEAVKGIVQVEAAVNEAEREVGMFALKTGAIGQAVRASNILRKVNKERRRLDEPAGTPQRELAKLQDPADRLAKIAPISWVHLPKCGSSFANMLIDLPDFCPGIPESERLPEYDDHQLADFNKKWKILGDGCGKDRFSKWGDHRGMGMPPMGLLFSGPLSTDTYTKIFKRHSVGFFRDPTQRVISGFHHNYHSYWSRITPKGKKEVKPTMEQYAERLKGCSVKMLSRRGFEPCTKPKKVKKGEVDRAIRRLREAFVFVGITDQWEASVCAFHKMFGGVCRHTDFEDSRVGAAHKHMRYDVAAEGLAGYHDEADTRLYEEAVEIFRIQRQLFNVTQEGCAACFQEAGVNPEIGAIPESVERQYEERPSGEEPTDELRAEPLAQARAELQVEEAPAGEEVSGAASEQAEEAEEAKEAEEALAGEEVVGVASEQVEDFPAGPAAEE